MRELFELELIGGATERRYRTSRPDIERLPWGTLHASVQAGAFAPNVVADARRDWTVASFQEHRTGAQCASALRALIECRAPIDLVAGFARFPLDELVHVELAARLAMELGGATALAHTPSDMVLDPDPSHAPLLRAAELVMRTFCVGESLSIPLLHASWQSATHPLVRGALGCIVRDEAAHGIVGWTFLDWVDPHLDAADRQQLDLVARHAIGEIERLWETIRKRQSTGPRPANGLGWTGDDVYLENASNALARRVVQPLRERGYLSGGTSWDEVDSGGATRADTRTQRG
jgi:hypothetical protein